MEDAFLKRTFSHPRTIELLIRRYLPEWAARVDYTTLEALPTELIGDKLGRRYTDTAWRVRSLDGNTDHVLILEFQGRPERAMVLRTTIYGTLAAQRLLEQDKELGRGSRGLYLACLVLYHGDRPWNAPTRLRDLFWGSAPDTYRLVSPGSPDSAAKTPLELPQVLLGLASASSARRMRAEVPVLRRLVAAFGDEDFDRFMARAVRAMLISRGIHSEELERAMSMDTVAVAFQRSLEEIKQEGRDEGIRQGREQGIRQGREQGVRQGREQGVRQGREQGIRQGLQQQVELLRQLTVRKFGPETADEVSRVLAKDLDPERIARIAESILNCDAAEDFLECVR